MPRISEDRKREIIAAFQRSFKQDNAHEIAGVPLIELRQADEMLGARDLDAGYRIALRNRISDLEAEQRTAEHRAYESKVRAWNLVTGIIIGLAVAGLTGWLFGN